MAKRLNNLDAALDYWGNRFHGLQVGVPATDVVTMLIKMSEQQMARKSATLANAIHYACSFRALLALLEMAKQQEADAKKTAEAKAAADQVQPGVDEPVLADADVAAQIPAFESDAVGA